MPENLAKFHWKLPQNRHTINDQNAGRKYSPAFLRLAANRGIQSIDELEKATDPYPTLFHDPFLLNDMEKAVERIKVAINQQEKILIYGDYDADGITSTLIIYESLLNFGADVTYYLPDRFKDGYGPNLDQYKYWIESGINLIITCDNGVSGHEAIDYANQREVDVIITDHHQMKNTIPDAYAVIHPQHPQGHYPFKELSGAGVALKLVTALSEYVPEEAVELAMIGTIADMVSLTDENRTIVLNGLHQIRYTQRPGLIRLCQTLDIDLKNINEETIGFIIAPRLNSTGRLDSASIGLTLLSSIDEEEVDQLVSVVEQLNQERKQLSDAIFKQIFDKLSRQVLPDIIIEADETWHPGVLGIVASRVLKTFQRPTILFHHDQENKVYKGSGRSEDNISLYDLLIKVNPLMKYFGGHGQAAGMTIDESQWDQFRQNLTQFAQQYRDEIQKPMDLMIDLIADINEINLQLFEEIECLGPFGMNNPRPKVLIEDCEVTQKRVIGADKQHIKMTLSDLTHQQKVDVIGFGKADQCSEISELQTISLVGTLNKNEWQQMVKIQLQFEDIGIKGIQWIDCRQSEIASDLFKIEDSICIFSSPNLLNHYQNNFSINHGYLYSDYIENPIHSVKCLVIVDLPDSLDQFIEILKLNPWKKIYLAAHTIESKYLVGEPSRDEMIKFYHWLSQQEPFEIVSQLPTISQILGIHEVKLKLILKMFLEAKFVTIRKHWIKFNHNSSNQKIDLRNLTTYKEYVQAIEIEKILKFKPINEIKNEIEGIL